MDMTEAEEKVLREEAYNDDIEPEKPELPPEPVQDLDSPQPEEAQEDDPWAGVPSALQDQIKAISERMTVIDNIDYRLKQTERRVGGIQNEFYAAQKAAKEQLDGPTPEELEKASKSQKAWDEMKEDFPDIATAIEGRLNQAKPVDINKLREEIKADLQKVEQPNPDLERRLVGVAHRDWQQVVRSTDYQAWLKKQPPAIQQKALHGETAEDAIDVLDRFKSSIKPKPIDQKKTDRLKKSVDTPRGPSIRPPKSEADLTESELRQQIADEVWS